MDYVKKSKLRKSIGKICDVSIIINSSLTPRIQEAHRTIYHIICEEVEKKFEGI